MLKLIQVELQKYKLRVFVRITIILALVLAIIGVLLPVIERIDTGSTEELFTDYPTAFTFINVMNGTVFVVFASVLIAKLVVEEYKNKTILLLFSYPIKRKKLMLAKMCIVASWTLIAVVISGAFTTLVFIAGNMFLRFFPGPVTSEAVLHQGMDLVFLGLTATGIGLIPFYVGMKSHSVPSTILSSLLITATLNFNPSGVSLSMTVIIPLSLASVGFFLAYGSLRRLEYDDVLK